MRRVLVVVAGAVLLGLATGCSSKGTPAPDEPSDASATAEAEPDIAEAPPPGPLEEYVGYAAAARTPEELVAEVARRENLTAACMAELGFDYEPQVPSVDEIQVSSGPEPGTREFVEAWGYGTWAAPAGGGGGSMSYTSSSDPNRERWEAMSDAAREAFDTALSGPLTVGEDGGQFRPGGCDSVGDVPAGPQAEYLTGVQEEARAFLAALRDDSRFAEVDAAWASCMADAGFTYDNPFAAQDAVFHEWFAEVDGTVGPDPAPIDERAEAERRLAVADLDCQEETDWRARHRVVEVQLQQEYVDAHRADLDALAASLGAGEG